MNYIEGFTKIQYNAVRSLNDMMADRGVGHVYLSPNALFHGKMYSFLANGDCQYAFVGSSNLGSFVGTTQNYIEADAVFENGEARLVNEKICEVMNRLGKTFSQLPEPELFLPNPTEIFVNNLNVKKATDDDRAKAKVLARGPKVRIPFKSDTARMSNLNTYFGKGKVKGRFSPRGWYEVEMIIPVSVENRDLIPWDYENKLGELIKVITDDGYVFECGRQGTNGKNFRSSKDLKILGKWIKGHMENEGALEVGQLVTKDVLDRFGKHELVLQKTFDDFWLLTME